jgi:integrase
MHQKMITFKKETINQLPPLSKRYHISDRKIHGLQLVVYPTGVKTFLLYRKVQGVPERIKIGRYPDITIEQARNQAQKLASIITLGGNPQKDRIAERRQITFRDLYAQYYDHHALKFTKRPLDNKKMMEHQVFPIFGNQKVNHITSDQIRHFHSKIGANRAGATANRLIAVISAVFNFGIREKIIDCKNPCTGLRKYKTVSRDRFLNFQELEAFYTALEEEKDLFRDFFKILLFTGARKSNVLSMRWTDVDMDLKRWRIPENQTKNGDINIVPLSESALDILKNRAHQNTNSTAPSLFIFPGESQDVYLKDPKRAFDRIRKRMNVFDIRIHDLRRTLGSYMAISGASLPMIGKALNHKSQVSTAIYARLSQDPVLEAVNVAAQLMSGKTI